ncbi:ATP-binding protein [bacterium]|nr:ATP-binding protein [bacterium]
MIKREKLSARIIEGLSRSNIVSIMGPRQCGKTTLAKMISSKIKPSHFFDLENPRDSARLTNPMMALENLTGLVILDEIQRMPELFLILRVLVDKKISSKFLLLGSASPDIIKHVSESLAGRVEFVHMSGFSLEEIDNLDQLWIRGNFPRSYLAKNINDSIVWRENFVTTFLERDLGQFGINVSPQAMRRFLLMLAHTHGNVWNASDISRSMGISFMTAKRYVDILSGAFMVRQLQPWFENISKRQVKSPKVFIRDSGIFHYLLQIKSKKDLFLHPKLGVSWEGYTIEQIINGCGERNCYFWRTQAGAELDLLWLNSRDKIGFEAKCTDTVQTTKSMRVALNDLNLTHLFVVYPGQESFQLDEKITAIPLNELLQKLKKINNN